MRQEPRPAAGRPSPYRRPRRPAPATRPVVALPLTTLLLAAFLTGVGGCADSQQPDAAWRAGRAGLPTPSGGPASPSVSEPEAGTISLSATGDIIMGNAPARLPANDGKGFFSSVRAALAADVVMGNLEEPLTEDTGYAKCAAPTPASPSPGATGKPAKSSGCHQFRAPPEYAAHLRDAGFMVLNQANNHANDYGPAGYQGTQRALAEHHLRHTGSRGQITVVAANGVRVAVVGFSPYSAANSVTNVGAAKKIVARAASRADLVVVQVHMGAEGADKTRVKPGTEMFLGENRGDPIKFSHAVIDAGADLVVGHGPHVLRALEFYQGRLIAYSLGNFAGGGNTLSSAGALGWGAVLRVSLRRDGSFASGKFVSTYMNGAGKPTIDRRERGLDLVTRRTAEDFPSTGARLGSDGAITVR